MEDATPRFPFDPVYKALCCHRRTLRDTAWRYLINVVDEGKNANVVHRLRGHDHIPQRFAPLVDAFTQQHLSPYLNHHRSCPFATERAAANGCIRRVYRAADVQTPYEKLRPPPHAETRLKPGVSFAQLDAQRPAGRPVAQRRARPAVPQHRRGPAGGRVTRPRHNQARTPAP